MSMSTEELFPRSGETKTEEGRASDEEMELRQVKSDPISTGNGPIPTGNNDESTTATDIDLVLPTSSTSTASSETVCRICQTGTRDTSEELQSSSCDCKGNMSRVHDSCLRQWVRYKGSNRCEICNARFENILAPPNPGILQLEALQQLHWHLDRARPFNRRKRAFMCAMIIFLVIVTSVTSLLTVSADREFKRVTEKPSSKEEVEESNIVFSVCIAFSFFCATLTIGLIIIWLGMECCFILNRRSIVRRATRRIFANPP